MNNLALTASWQWLYRGQERPPFALPTAPGQESVWDYPRPPRLVSDAREVTVFAGDIEIARTRRAMRVLETASPPTFYLPPQDVRVDLLSAALGSSLCEWKGRARHWTVRTGERRLVAAAWSYDDPFPEFAALRDLISFYPSRLACHVDGIRVLPQPGEFYAGWITPEVVGPFKGGVGSSGW